MPKKISLSPEDAAVLLDMADSMIGPGDAEKISYSLRQARYIFPILMAEFERLGLEPEDIERPALPFLRPQWMIDEENARQ